MTSYVRYYRKSHGDDFNTQVMRCDQYASRMGLSLDTSLGNDGVYEDKDISGGREDRAGYQALLHDIILGKLKGKYVVARDQERITRGKSSYFEEFMYNVELGGVRVFEATSGREIKDDLTSGVLAVVARQDRKRTAVLLQGRKEWHALEGHTPTGKDRRYGYTKGYTIVFEEAKVLRRVRKWVVAGRSLRSIAKDLNESGVRRVHGSPFNTTHISRMLKAPEYAALRSFKRDIEVDGVVIPKGKPVAKGTWPAIFTQEEHEEVVAALSKNARWATDGKVKYLLVGILVCDECGTGMGVGYPSGNKARVYRCDTQRMGCGKVARKMETLDNFFLGLTYKAIQKMPKVEVDKPDNSAQIKELEGKIAESRQAYKSGKIGIDDFSDIRADIQAQIKDLKKTQDTEPLPIEDAEAFIKSEDMDKQRDTIRRFWPVVGVKPCGKGYTFSPDQLVFPESA